MYIQSILYAEHQIPESDVSSHYIWRYIIPLSMFPQVLQLNIFILQGITIIGCMCSDLWD